MASRPTPFNIAPTTKLEKTCMPSFGQVDTPHQHRCFFIRLSSFAYHLLLRIALDSALICQIFSPLINSAEFNDGMKKGRSRLNGG